jgi:hypothetical protein
VSRLVHYRTKLWGGSAESSEEMYGMSKGPAKNRNEDLEDLKVMD